MTAFVVDMNFVEEKFPSDINLCIVMHDRPVNMMIQLAHF
jgi:hypothetical protein